MSKNKGKMGQSATAVEPDQFVAGVVTFADRVKPHTKKLVILGAVVIVASLVLVTWRWMNARTELKASNLYTQAADILARRVVAPPAKPDPVDSAADDDKADGEPDDVAAPEDEAPFEDPDAEPSFPSIAARAQAALVPLRALRSEHGGTKVAHGARMLHAATEALAGNVDDALTLYQAVAASSSTALASLAREQIGYLYEQQAMALADATARQAGLQKALEAFRAIQPKDGPRREYALYHEARMLALLDKRDEAIAALKQALEVAPESAIHEDIDGRLAQLEAQAPIAAAAPAVGAP